MKIDLVTANCIDALSKGGEKGNVRPSDTEDGLSREESCLGQSDLAITAA